MCCNRLHACGLVVEHVGVLDVQADLVHNVAVTVDRGGHEVSCQLPVIICTRGLDVQADLVHNIAVAVDRGGHEVRCDVS